MMWRTPMLPNLGPPETAKAAKGTGQINEALWKVLAHNICLFIHAMHTLNIQLVLHKELATLGSFSCKVRQPRWCSGRCSRGWDCLPTLAYTRGSTLI